MTIETMCTNCREEPPTDGYRQCATCREMDREQRRALHERRRMAGLCACGQKPQEGRSTCPDCAAKFAARRQANLDRGLCGCGRAEPVPGIKTCQICLDSKAASAARRKRRFLERKGRAAEGPTLVYESPPRIAPPRPRQP